MNEVLIYDTTLRDGMQGEGMSLSAAEKLRVAHALDALGVHVIEAGFPSSNPKEQALFDLLAQESFANAEIAAFGMTRRRDLDADEDPALQLLADCVAPICTLVGKTWALHLQRVTRVGRAENLRMIADSVAFLRQRGKRVIYDAEHFFDAYADAPAYTLDCLRAAVEAGAENVTLCDTNGASLPFQVADAVQAAVEAVGAHATVGIHTHDDSGCAVANSLVAVERGARLVQGTMNGYGERCGNANLVTVVAALELKLGYSCIGRERLERLTETAHLVDGLCNVAPNPNQPYVGRNAFAHKGGMHVAGVVEDARTFEHVDPALVGNDRHLLVSELSGRNTVQARADAAGIPIDAPTAARVVEHVKQLEHAGYQFEAADGSFELLIRREAGAHTSLFVVDRWRVIVEKRAEAKVETEATVWLRIGDEEPRACTARGNGPLHALDAALRAAVRDRYPHLHDIKLSDFKVRILDGRKGTGAVTRVLLYATDGVDEWGTIGVSENVIEASWQALVESLEVGMLPTHADHHLARTPPDEAATVANP